jgi:hypothetical protein
MRGIPIRLVSVILSETHDLKEKHAKQRKKTKEGTKNSTETKIDTPTQEQYEGLRSASL